MIRRAPNHVSAGKRSGSALNQVGDLLMSDPPDTPCVDGVSALKMVLQR